MAAKAARYSQGTRVLPFTFVSPISFDSGHSSSQTIAQYGNSSKPFVFYAETDISSPLSSSTVGLLINRGDSTKKINLAVDNIGVEVSYT